MEENIHGQKVAYRRRQEVETRENWTEYERARIEAKSKVALAKHKKVKVFYCTLGTAEGEKGIHQFGFRPGRSTMEPILILGHMVDKDRAVKNKPPPWIHRWGQVYDQSHRSKLWNSLMTPWIKLRLY